MSNGMVFLMSLLSSALVVEIYLAYRNHKVLHYLWEHSYLFRYSFKQVKPSLWAWTKNQFFSHGLLGALSCMFLVMPFFQLPFLLGKEHSLGNALQIVIFMSLFGAALVYLLHMTLIKVVAKSWVDWLNRNTDIIEKTKEEHEKAQILKFKKKLNQALPTATPPQTTRTKRL